MTYATQQDIIDQLGEREVLALTDRGNVGTIDTAVLQGALDDASAEIDAYVGSRYAVPLSVVSRLFVTYACDIARYRLSGADVTEVDVVRNRYKDALRFLESVRDGKIDLAADVAQAPANDMLDLAFTASGNPGVFSRKARRC